MTEFEQLIKERYDQLPAELQQAISNSDWEKEVRDIVFKYKLHIDQGEELEYETFYVFLGLCHPKDFPAHIADKVKVTNEIAGQIAQDINDRVFIKVRGLLREIYDEEDAVTQENEAALDKDQILAGIENPPAKTAAQGYVAPKIVAAKFAGPVVSKKQEVNIVEQAPVSKLPEKPTPAPKAYTVDPYRELPN